MDDGPTAGRRAMRALPHRSRVHTSASIRACALLVMTSEERQKFQVRDCPCLPARVFSWDATCFFREQTISSFG
jgi:hypothetical protein